MYCRDLNIVGCYLGLRGLGFSISTSQTIPTYPDESLSEGTLTKGAVKNMRTVHESHFGESKASGRRATTFSVILSLCYRLRCRTWLTGPGDNQAVRLSIRLPDGVDPKTALGLASAPKVPRGSIVVPFWDYLMGFLIRAPKRNYYGAYVDKVPGNVLRPTETRGLGPASPPEGI